MYDVKQFVPEEWSSPPLEGRIVEKDGLGKICVGRGAVNQKGPEASFLAALHAFKAAGRKLPVNLVLVCEGEEEIASPHFAEVVRNPKVMAELRKICTEFPTVFSEARGKGLILGLKCLVPAGEVQAAFTGQGLMTVTAGENVVRIVPPLVITDSDIADAVAMMRRGAATCVPAAQAAQ